MRVLAVHPGPLMYTKIFLRLEPLGLELVCAAVRRAGHEARLIDLQSRHAQGLLRARRRLAAGRGGVLLQLSGERSRGRRPCQADSRPAARNVRLRRRPQRLLHRAGAARARGRRHRLHPQGRGRGLGRRAARGRRARPSGDHPGPGRRQASTGRDRPRAWSKASMRSSRPATCSGAAVGTFSARSTPAPRSSSRAAAPGTVPSAARGRSMGGATAWSARSGRWRIWPPIREPGVFIVDDVAFVQSKHGFEIGEAIARRGIRKKYYLETRGDVLLRNKDVFRMWTRLGLEYMFLGLEAIDEEGLAQVPQADLARPRLRSPRVRALARNPGRHQPDRRPRLGSRALRRGPPVVPGDPRDREHLGQHPLSGNGNLANRGAANPHARLSALRHPARGAADALAARRLLRGAGPHPARAGDEAHGVGRAPGPHDDRARPSRARPDELRPEPLEVRPCVRSQALAGRSSAAGVLRDEAAAARAGRRSIRGASTSCRRAAARVAPSTMRPSSSSTRPGWARANSAWSADRRHVLEFDQRRKAP